MVAAGTQRQRERSTTGYTLDDGGDDSGDALDQWQASLDNRVALQASVTWSGLQDGSIDAGAGDAANPYTSVYWTLQPVKTMHCGDCIDLAAKSPYDPPWDTSPGSNQLNQTPGDGQTECGAGCKCELDYKPNWSEIQALAAGQGWHFWLGPNAVPYPGGGIEDMGTAAGYAPPNIAEYGQSERDQAAAAQGYTPPSAVLRPFWQQDARRIGQVGQLGRSPQLAVPEQIPGPTGDTLSEGQQRALDRFREAVRAWDTVRGGLPEAPRLFEIGDAGEIIEREGVLPEWDSLTSAQQLAVNDLVAALWEWFEAAGYLDDLDDLDGGGGGDQQFAERASERGAYRLGLPGGGQPVGYDQPRGAHGHWAPGLGRTQQEHEAAGGRAGGLRGPAGEVHEHAPGGGGGAQGSSGSGNETAAEREHAAAQAEYVHTRDAYNTAYHRMEQAVAARRNAETDLAVTRARVERELQAAQVRDGRTLTDAEYHEALRTHPDVVAATERLSVAAEESRQSAADVSRTLVAHQAAHNRAVRAAALVEVERGGTGVDISYVSLRGGQVGAPVEARARAQIERVFGRALTDHELVALAGARPGDRIMIVPADRTDKLTIHVTGPEITRDFEVFRDSRDGAVVLHDGFTENKGAKTADTGAQLIHGLETAHRLGVDKVTCVAGRLDGSGRETMNGYYTWARLGFTGKIPFDGLTTRALDELETRFGLPTRVEQLMRLPGGAQWWKQNGDAWNATFDFRNPYSLERLAHFKAIIERHGDGGSGSGSGDPHLSEGASDGGAYQLGLPGGGQPAGYDQPRGPHGRWAPGAGRTAQQEHEAAGGNVRRPDSGEIHERGAGPAGSRDGAGAKSGSGGGGDATKGENPDAKPFSHEEFLAAKLEPFKGHGGHQPVFSTSINGHEYIVKSYKHADGEYERLDHEIAARAIAKEVGLEHETIPVWREVGADGTEYGVFPRVLESKSVAEYKRQDGVKEAQTFRYLPDNVRQRIGLWAYVIGEPDRVSPNFLVNPATHEVYSIDHTRAFGRQTRGEFSAAYFRQAIGNGKLNSWRDAVIPRDELRQMLTHTERVVAIADAFHVRGGAEAVRDRLTIVRNALDRYTDPTYANLIEEAKRLGPRPYQKSWEVPEVKMPW